MMQTVYNNQVRLLVSLLPIVGKQSCFALKGGTAINLFIRNMPRLSVDIDLAYLPIENRADSLRGIDTAFGKIIKEIEKLIPRVQITALTLKESDTRYKLLVQQDKTIVKIEVTPVLRGSVYPAKIYRISEKPEKEFGFAEMSLLSFEDLFAGKICATLDRQHPRDLHDTFYLLENEGIDERLKNAFLVYLMAHNRPMAELLAPMPKDISPDYRAEFEGMTFKNISLKELQQTLPRLVNKIHSALSDQDRRFLLSFKQGNHDWQTFFLPEVEKLPAIQWKLLNLKRMGRNKRLQAVEILEQVLYQHQAG